MFCHFAFIELSVASSQFGQFGKSLSRCGVCFAKANLYVSYYFGGPQLPHRLFENFRQDLLECSKKRRFLTGADKVFAGSDRYEACVEEGDFA
ncbi:hypothetical protein Zmor_025554 [Zophobas morio]|uniref:Uncharacterized protein n=1 Tax=Zophobas morio TaxID=2755281 RepID=A0AA38M3R8_9CUCU|nr:hypothetical protein Zmor_025554 [Zophobas morio]